MRDIFIQTLLDAALKDPNIILITGDLGFKVFDEYREKLPKQFLNAGVAEQNMVGLATGLALEGYNVFVYSIGNFSTLRCFEQIRNDVCYHDANVKIVSVGAGFSYGSLGISHHATEDISIMRTLPGITICSPGCDWEAKNCTQALIELQGPGYLRLDKTSAGSTQLLNETFELAKIRILKEGNDVTIVTTSGILKEVLKASEVLLSHDLSAQVISVPTIKPFDKIGLVNAIRHKSGLVVVEEHTTNGGLGGLIAETLLENSFMPEYFINLGLESKFSSVVGSQEYLQNVYGLSANHIVASILSSMKNNTIKIANL
jgi:transketolase